MYMALWGFVGTMFFTELVRKVFYHQGLRQKRMAPRIRPILTGVIERLLFTILAIVLIRADSFTALGAIAAGYVGLKGISREEKTKDPIYVSLHSIWGSGVSIAFAVFAGWLFIEMTLAPAA